VGYDARRYTLLRDMAFEERMLHVCTDFWINHVEADVPPPFDDGKGTQAYLRLMHGEVSVSLGEGGYVL
jgi:predicted phage-related endonuclease